MVVRETKLKGCLLLKPQIFTDKRGYFLENYNKKVFNEATNLNINFVQDNESFSSKGVLRGLHYRLGKHAQAKLVRVISGRVWDVVVDLRPDSKTFGQHLSFELSDDNKKQIFIPRGFAHGFLAMEDDTIFSYKCDNYYNKRAEKGIIYSDSDLNINWNFPDEELIVSDKDLSLPFFKDAVI